MPCSVSGQVVYRRAVSKKLVFYDVERCDGGVGVEVVVKVGTFALGDIKQLRDTVKLGDLVTVEGHQESPYSILATSLVVVQPWKDQAPNQRQFVPRPLPIHAKPSAAGGDAEADAPSTSAEQGDGDGFLGVCKFWVNTGSCAKGALCPHMHTPLDTRGGARRQWELQREHQRRYTAASAGFHHKDDASSKRLRAAAFADWLVNTFGVEMLSSGTGVVDVAGGQGGVSFQLGVRYKIPVLLVDPRPAKISKIQRRFLQRHQQQHNTARQKPKPQEEAAAGMQRDQAPPANCLEEHMLGDVHEANRLPGPPGFIDSEEDTVLRQHAEEFSTPASALLLDVAGAADGDASEPAAERSEQSTGLMGPAAGLAERFPEQRTASTPSAPAENCWQCPQLQLLFEPDLWRQSEHASALQRCSMVVGMHPDQATESILEFALEFGKPFAILPCCVFAREFPHRRVLGEEGVEETVESYPQLVRYLQQKGGAELTQLNFRGANIVVYRHKKSGQARLV